MTNSIHLCGSILILAMVGATRPADGDGERDVAKPAAPGSECVKAVAAAAATAAAAVEEEDEEVNIKELLLLLLLTMFRLTLILWWLKLIVDGAWATALSEFSE